MPVKRIAKWLVAHELAVLAAVAPLLLFPGPWSAPAALLIPLLWAGRRVATGRFSVPTPVDGALALVLLTSLVGLVASVDLARSLDRWWSILLGLALASGLANGLATGRALRRAGDLLVVGGTGVAGLALLGTDWGGVRFFDLPWLRGLPAVVRDPVDGALFNARIMGMALAVLLPPVLAVALWGRGRRRRGLAALAGAGMAGTLLITQSVQAALGLGVALLAVAVGWRRWALLALPLGLALGGGIVLALGPASVAAALLSVDHPLGLAVILRWDMWARALAMLRDLPYTGIGLDTFPQIQTGFYPGLLLGPEPHAHNLYLQVALDLGLPGLAGLAWLVGALGAAVRRSLPRLPDGDARVLLVGASAGLVAYLGAGLVDTLWAAKPGILFWVLVGLALAACRQAGGWEALARPGRRFLPLGVVIALVAGGIVLWPSLAARNRGAMEAHRALVRAEAGEGVDVAALERAAQRLEQSLAGLSGQGTTYRTLGRLYGWLRGPERGVEFLARGVEVDGAAPLVQYAPWVRWQRRLEGHAPADRWEDLVWVYRHWTQRFPGRAEAYVQIALVRALHQEDPARARAVLEAGLERGAQPEALLLYYRERLE